MSHVKEPYEHNRYSSAKFSGHVSHLRFTCFATRCLLALLTDVPGGRIRWLEPGWSWGGQGPIQGCSVTKEEESQSYQLIYYCTWFYLYWWLNQRVLWSLWRVVYLIWVCFYLLYKCKIFPVRLGVCVFVLFLLPPLYLLSFHIRDYTLVCSESVLILFG
jgi:hypothetical protein